MRTRSALLILVFAGCAACESAAPVYQPAIRNGAVVWLDGANARPQVLVPDMLVEWRADGDSDWVVPDAFSGAKLKEDLRAVRVWQVDAAELRAAIDIRRAGGPVAECCSPLLKDPGGNLRALPGGVIVTFAQGISEVDAQKWAAARKLSMERKAAQPLIYLIQTPRGLQALGLSNELQDDPALTEAEPNWWQPRSLRQ